MAIPGIFRKDTEIIIRAIMAEEAEKAKGNKEHHNYNMEKFDPRWDETCSRIKKRDGHCCQMCGKTNVYFRIHHIFYIKGKAYWDHPDELLITLCDACHNKIHAVERMLKVIVPFMDASERYQLYGYGNSIIDQTVPSIFQKEFENAYQEEYLRGLNDGRRRF